MIHNLRLVKAAWDLKETLQARKVVPGMQEQVIQVEFKSKARQPRPFDTISEGATRARGQAPPLPGNGTRSPMSITQLACSLTTTGKQLFKGKFVIFNRPEISHSFEVTQHDCYNSA